MLKPGPFPLLLLPFLNFELKESYSVTLLGLFRYDKITDSFSVIKLDTLFAGGFAELKSILSDKI